MAPFKSFDVTGEMASNVQALVDSGKFSEAEINEYVQRAQKPAETPKAPTGAPNMAPSHLAMAPSHKTATPKDEPKPTTKTDPAEGDRAALKASGQYTDAEIDDYIKKAYPPKKTGWSGKQIASDIYHPVLEMGGLLGGGALGAGSGLLTGPGAVAASPVGAAVGGAAGYLGGKSAARGFDQLLGLRSTPSIGKQALDIAKDVPEAVTMGGMGPVSDVALGGRAAIMSPAARAMLEQRTGTKVASGELAGIPKWIGKNVISPVWGRIMSWGTPAVEQAVKSGTDTGLSLHPMASSTDFDRALRGHITGEEITQKAVKAAKGLEQMRGARYEAEMAPILKDTTPIDTTPLKDEATESLKSEAGKVGGFIRWNEPKTITATAPGLTAKAIPNPGQGGGFVIEREPGKYVMSHGAPQWFRSEAEATKAAATISKPGATTTQTIPGSFNWKRATTGSDSDALQLKEHYDYVMNWGKEKGDNTIQGLNEFKRHFQNAYSPNSDIRAFTERMADKAKQMIIDRAPQYKDAMKHYEEAINLQKDIQATLLTGKQQGLSGRVTADSVSRRLLSAMKDNFQMRTDMLHILSDKSGEDLMAQVAGFAMSHPLPYGIQGSGGFIAGEMTAAYEAVAHHIISPWYTAILAASSPRLSGEILRLVGKTAIELAGTAGVIGQGAAYETESFADHLRKTSTNARSQKRPDLPQ